MQGRMKQHPLNATEIAEVLNKSEVGRIATNDPNGFPYIVPVHYIYWNEKIYIHGLVKGQKIDYLKLDSKVGFEVDEMGAILPDEHIVCDTNTVFRSVILLGNAQMVDETDLKRSVLKRVVEKYTPELSHLEFPENMFKATGIIEITPVAITGKYYK
ncbi:pyridoxamine 5'-phosphate oxidase family protein [Bacteroides reticulotermitis]|uniref:pyridoxamine 5'-phosphate oxidase family protein n=1 Tax=Bacteroides reticulotermitis TaxID=1133319 RepID=UPI003A86D420